ncbi:tyrosine-type recombinase/integrase [Streptococcus cristatus]|uniref:tyrosine-type recombinase/integrase n=1 Tax=Streptococcus cristatus TaxID=45634 RepID=UPI00228493D7|nr:tyrosine-type recombinase/integrase [Streptococcus cristatus]
MQPVACTKKSSIDMLRHTYASYLISKEVDLISISKVLGHENLTITLEVYTHRLEQQEEKNRNRIRNIFETFRVDLGQI